MSGNNSIFDTSEPQTGMSLRRRIVLSALALIVVTGVVLALWALWIEPRRLVLNHATLDLPRWSPALDGLRVVHLTDLHIGSPHTGLEKLEEVVRLTNEQRADVIVVTGDFLIDDVIGGAYVPPAPIVERVARLRARHGVFVVLGNHDWRNEGVRLKRLLEAEGVRVLEDSAEVIEHNGGRVWMVGVSDLWTRKADIDLALRDVPEVDAKIVFTQIRTSSGASPHTSR